MLIHMRELFDAESGQRDANSIHIGHENVALQSIPSLIIMLCFHVKLWCNDYPLALFKEN